MIKKFKKCFKKNDKKNSESRIGFIFVHSIHWFFIKLMTFVNFFIIFTTLDLHRISFFLRATYFAHYWIPLLGLPLCAIALLFPMTKKKVVWNQLWRHRRWSNATQAERTNSSLRASTDAGRSKNPENEYRQPLLPEFKFAFLLSTTTILFFLSVIQLSATQIFFFYLFLFQSIWIWTVCIKI